MEKLKVIPRFATEITLTIILFVALWALWNFVIKESVVLSDQGLSTIGIALSTSIGVLTAIVVSFVLIIWQWSREARSSAFWRWRNALDKLVEFFDAKLGLLWDICDEVKELSEKSAEVSLITPMPRDKFKELIDKVFSKMAKSDEELQEEKEPSKEEVLKQQAYMYISNYLPVLTTANFEHRISHNAFKQVERLEGLLYRLLALLSASVLTVAVSVTNASKGISDVFNAPLAVILLIWFVYVLVQLGRKIGAIVFLEKQFREEKLNRKEV